ncbi:hypothetical protein JCM15579A_14950 [Marinifilum fragile]
MKKMLRNIITLLLLGFYLIGFCGVHFIKHSCFSCEHSEIHFTVDADCIDSVDCKCCCDQHDHDKKHHKISELGSLLCCDYNLVYLKTDPNTTLTETSKAPIVIETLLLFENALYTASNSNTTITKSGYVDDYPDDYIQVDRCKLCTFLC